MKRHMLFLLLALSVLFNLFFVAGYAKARRAAAERDDAVMRVAEALRLDDGQSARFRQLVDAERAERAVFDDAITFTRIELLEELARETPDEARVAELSTRKSELEQQRRQSRSEVFEEFFRSLGPEQRERLRERLHREHERPGPPRRVLERFDVNRDGKLSPDEWERARDAGGLWPRRPDPAKLFERHDGDKSGCLDPAEVEKLLRDRPGRRHGGGGRHPDREGGGPPLPGPGGEPEPAAPTEEPGA